MLIMSFLATLLTCASPSICPSAAELKAALVQRRAEEVATALAAKGVSDPGGIFSEHPYPITGWSNMLCGEPGKEEPHALRCRVTVHYGTKRQRVTADLVRDEKGWAVIDDSAIFTG